MKKIHQKLPNSKFEVSSNVVTATICKDSGKVANSYCKNTYKEYFLKGTIPTECTEHSFGNIPKNTQTNKSTQNTTIKNTTTNSTKNTTNNENKAIYTYTNEDEDEKKPNAEENTTSIEENQIEKNETNTNTSISNNTLDVNLQNTNSAQNSTNETLNNN